VKRLFVKPVTMVSLRCSSYADSTRSLL